MTELVTIVVGDNIAPVPNVAVADAPVPAPAPGKLNVGADV